MTRMMMLSDQLPTKPAMAPRMVPITMAKPTVAKPTISEMRAP